MLCQKNVFRMTRVHQCSEVNSSAVCSCFVSDVVFTFYLLTNSTQAVFMNFVPIFVHYSFCCWNLHGFAVRHGRAYQNKMMPRMTSSICNVILMRMISSFVKNTPLIFERFYLPFSSRQRTSPFAHCQVRVSSRLLFDTATLCVGA